MKNIFVKQIHISLDNFLKLYARTVFALMFILSYFYSSNDEFINIMEPSILIMAILVVLPTFVHIRTSSKELKIFKEFFKKIYSKFVMFMTMVLVLPLIAFVTLGIIINLFLTLSGVVATLRPNSGFWTLSLTIFLIAAHLITASNIIKNNFYKRAAYVLATLFFVFFSFEKDVGALSPLYYLFLQFII